jgi:hypothetical protein
MTKWAMLSCLAIGFSPNTAQASSPQGPNSEVSNATGASGANDKTWGWAIVITSIAAGAALTAYGMTRSCPAHDEHCAWESSFFIWGGVGVASAGSIVGLSMVRF